jgi:hypothetical protein
VVAVAAGNLVISSISVTANAAVTVGTGETELAEATSGSSSENRTQVQYSTDAAHDWAWITTEQNWGVAVEYAAAATATFVPRQGMIIG